MHALITLSGKKYALNQRRVDMRTCILHTLTNISREPIDYCTKSALTGLNGVHLIFG